MKLYSDDSRTAPSPRRVRVFLAEKNVDVDIVDMKLHEDNRASHFREKNPLARLPVLELDDGTTISESLAICRYIEALSPDPHLFGKTPLEIAIVEMWNRRAELSFYLPIEYAGGFLGEEVAQASRRRVDKMLRLLDEQLQAQPFVAGFQLSVADITTLVAIDFGVRYNDIVVPDEVHNFRRWWQAMKARDSATA